MVLPSEVIFTKNVQKHLLAAANALNKTKVMAGFKHVSSGQMMSSVSMYHGSQIADSDSSSFTNRLFHTLPNRSAGRSTNNAFGSGSTNHARNSYTRSPTLAAHSEPEGTFQLPVGLPDTHNGVIGVQPSLFQSHGQPHVQTALGQAVNDQQNNKRYDVRDSAAQQKARSVDRRELNTEGDKEAVSL